MIDIYYDNPFGEDLKIRLQVHDELVLEAKEEIVEECKDFVVKNCWRQNNHS